MRSHHHRHLSNDRYGHRHKNEGITSDSYPEVDSRGFDTIQSWLAKISNSADDYVHNADESCSSTKRPARVPAWARSLDPNQLGHQSDWPLIENQLLAVAPESLEDETYLNSQHARCPGTGSNKENQKRYRTHSCQGSLDGIPDRPLFERRPRRKTRQDRYTSKDQVAKEKSHTEGETENRRRKTRPKKHHLRSSRDVMNNFVSGAIPSTRVTMRPSLTTGLFLNGRSSTARQVTDLTFNDMPVMKLRGSGNEKEELHLSTPTQSDHDEDETLEDGSYMQQHAESSTGSTENTKENKRQVTNKAVDTVPQNLSLEDTHGIQDGLMASAEVAQTSDSESPEVTLKRLIETGIFDGTGILNKTANQIIQQNSINSSNLDPRGNSNSPPNQDKGVLADPSMGAAYSDMYTIQDERHGCNTQLSRQHDNHDDETIQQFIERIEGEASSRWEEPHKVVDGSFMDDIEDSGESESKRAQDGSDTFLRGDLGYSEIAQHASHNAYPDLYCEPTIERPQYEPVYGRKSDNEHDYHFACRTDRGFDCLEPDLPTFWRPNRS
ncbi:hypothetical protein HG530_004762 [Fusarium avenaceum]|nr:hypothetical protein HG530_004762 [Fusarium avenaceum]